MKDYITFWIWLFSLPMTMSANVDSLRQVMAKNSQSNPIIWCQAAHQLQKLYVIQKADKENKAHLQEAVAYAEQHQQTSFFYQFNAILAKLNYYEDRNFEKAVQIFNNATSYFEVQRDYSNLIQTKNTNLVIHYWESKYLEAIEIGRTILPLQIHISQDEFHRIARTNNILGLCHKNSGQLDAAFKYFEKSIELYKRVQHQSLLAPLGNLAALNLVKGFYSEALEVNSEVIQIREKRKQWNELSIAYYLRGEIYEKMGDFKNAQRFFQKSLSMRMEYQYLRDISFNHIKLGDCWLQLAQLDSAYFYYQAAAALINLEENSWAKADLYKGYGQYYKVIGETEKAKQYLRESIETSKAFDSSIGHFNATILLTDLQLEEGNYQKALRQLKKVVADAEKVNSPEVLAKVYENLVEGYAALNQPAKQLSWYKKLAAIQDTIAAKNSLSQINEVILKFETAEKEREIATLALEKAQSETQAANRLFQIGLIASVLIILILGLLSWGIFQRYRNERKLNQTLQSIEHQVFEKVISINEGNNLDQQFNNQTKYHLAQIQQGILLLKTSTEREQELHQIVEELEAYNYSVSHDLKQPIQRVKQIAYLLETAKSLNIDENTQGYLHKLTDSVNQMEQLIETMLNFSQLSKYVLYRSNFSVQQLIEGIFQDYQGQIQERNIQISLAEMPDLFSDRELWKRVWTNLIDNAIKFSKAQQAEIEIGHEIKENQHFFWIRDNGEGFEPHMREKIFQAFFQSNQSNSEKGIGADLAISQRIIERMGGSIWAESEKGQGATFFITYLPDNSLN